MADGTLRPVDSWHETVQLSWRRNVEGTRRWTSLCDDTSGVVAVLAGKRVGNARFRGPEFETSGSNLYTHIYDTEDAARVLTDDRIDLQVLNTWISALGR